MLSSSTLPPLENRLAPSIEAEWKKLTRNNAIVANCLEASPDPRLCAIALAAEVERLKERLKKLDAIAPKKITAPDGKVYVWRCPEHLIPEN